MNRTEKQELVEKLHQEFEAAPHVVLVDFRGLSVPAATEFRRNVKAAGSRYRVVKNRLARIAADLLGATPMDRPEWTSTAPDGTIYISYDRNRSTDGEILLARFTEDDILARELVGPKSKLRMLISRPLARDVAKLPISTPLNEQSQ